jgi:hypothetical protein
MEHYPCPVGTLHPEVPDLGTEEYDGGDFTTFPQRHGWDKQKMADNRHFYKVQDSRDIEAFLQT